MILTAELTALNLDCAQQEGVVAAVLPLHAEAEKLRAQAKLDALKIQALTLELAHLKRIRFGVKNEALSPEQRDLFRETLEVDSAAIAAETELQVSTPRVPRERAGRQPQPEHLPRVEHHYEPASCTCGECGGALVKIGEDISEQLDVTPAQFFVHRHIRPQYACRPCERIVAAPIPPAVIDGGMAAAGLIAWVLISKYVDHLPLYRLEQIAARAGVTLARSTLADWVGRYGVALQPLADRLSVLLRQRCLLHADETPVQQLDPGQGKTKRAYLWAYRSGDLDDGPRIVVFDYQTGRSGAHARAFLGDWKGHLVVDDYAGYKALFAAGVIEVGCMAHARRKFFELHKTNQSPVAGEALQQHQRKGDRDDADCHCRHQVIRRRAQLVGQLVQIGGQPQRQAARRGPDAAGGAAGLAVAYQQQAHWGKNSWRKLARMGAVAPSGVTSSSKASVSLPLMRASAR